MSLKQFHFKKACSFPFKKMYAMLLLIQLQYAATAQTWVGVSTDWNSTANWSPAVIPTSLTDVTIPTGRPFYPVLTTATPQCRNFTNSGTITISASGTLSIFGNLSNSGVITNPGTIFIKGNFNHFGGNLDSFNGTINFNGSTTQNFSVTFQTTTTLYNIIVNNTSTTSGVTQAADMNILGTLSIINTGKFIVGAHYLNLFNPITGIPNNFSANNTSSIGFLGSVAGLNLPSSVTQLKVFNLSNSAGSTLQGNLNVATQVSISNGTVNAGTWTFDGTAQLLMSGGSLVLSKNGVALPEFTGTYTLNGGTINFTGNGTGVNAQTIKPINYANINFGSTGDRILSSTGIIGISGFFSPLLNPCTSTGSTVEYRGTTQFVAKLTYNNLTLSGGAFTKTLVGSPTINGVLTIAPNTKLALQQYNVLLKSDATNNATVANIPTANSITYGTGRFYVERYIPTGTGTGQHGKTWQFLSVPTTTGQTVKQAWQENATSSTDNPVPGYGTILTSDLPAALSLGFDFYTPTGSTIKTYNPAFNSWQSVSSTANPISNSIGYMLFVRGDRSVTTYNQVATPTILRTVGKLYAPGTDAPPPVAVGVNQLQSIGNPYASPISFTNLLSTSTGIDSKFYVWDPLLTSFYGYGAYQTLSSVNGYRPVPGGTTNYPTGVVCTTIQKGQAFFVGSFVGGTVAFAENNKTTGNLNVFKGGDPQENFITLRSYLNANLYNATGILSDGNVAVMDNLFSNSIDSLDAAKLGNLAENFAIWHGSDNKLLAVDARRAPTDGDTLFYNITGLTEQSYSFTFTPQNLSLPGLSVFLEDSYSDSQHPVNLTLPTVYNFTVNSNPTSKSPGRFFIVFRFSHRDAAKNNVTAKSSKGLVNAGQKNTGIKVYPNPITGKVLNIAFDNNETGKYHIQLINLQGQPVFNENMILTGNTTKKIILPGSVLPGTYCLRITEGSLIKYLENISIQ